MNVGHTDCRRKRGKTKLGLRMTDKFIKEKEVCFVVCIEKIFTRHSPITVPDLTDTSQENAFIARLMKKNVLLLFVLVIESLEPGQELGDEQVLLLQQQR